MARKKKNDFWDDVEDLNTVSDNDQTGDDDTAEVAVDEEWSAVKSLPLKVIMRFLLMVSCLVALVSAYIAYEYVNDRYAGGSYSTDFFDSASFADEYNKSMDQLLQLVQAMEADPSVTQAGNEELLTTLVENYMGKDTNFSFMILDSDKYRIAASGDDAKDRIEGSNHYVAISNMDGQTSIQSPIAGKLLDKDAWTKVLSETSNKYIIYSAVDNTLAQPDSFYKAEMSFEKMGEYFGAARFVGIIAAVIFVICLIFCIMSTGMKRGYDGVCLTWWDRVFTEIALVVMIAVAIALGIGVRKLMKMDGDLYHYGAAALAVVTYGWVIRSYFSMVRRIKAGRLLRCSIIGTIVGGISRGIGKLPSPLNVIVGAVILVAINGGLIYGVIFMRQYTVKGIPVMFIAAPVIFIIELLALLVHSGGSDDEDDEVEEETEQEPVDEEDDVRIAAAPGRKNTQVQETERVQNTPANDEPMDWEAMDLGKAIAEAERSQTQKRQNTSADILSEQTVLNVQDDMAEGMTGYVASNVVDVTDGKTEVLSVEDVEKAIRESGLTPEIQPRPQAQPVQTAQTVRPAEETVVNMAPVKPVKEQPTAKQPIMEAADDGRVNFVQLNKDVRKEFRAALKARGVGVTVRAPEKPVIIDIDRNSLKMIITDIFTQIERFSADNERAYVEVYRQDGKVVYIVKITVAPDKTEEAVKAATGDNSFDNARKIVEANAGRFVVAFDNGMMKAGMMIDAAE